MALHPAETTDDDLAADCARRDDSPAARRRAEDAFHALYDRHARRLIAFLGGRVNASAVDDVHQEVWAKVWQAVPTGYRGGNFRAWVHQIARNVVIDHQRKRVAEPLAEPNTLADHRQRTDDYDADRHAALARCLKKLEQANARVAELVRGRVSGESYDALCARLGLPADQAYRAFHTAKTQLQQCVERGISP